MLLFNTVQTTNNNNQNNLKLYINVQKPGQKPVKVSFPISTVKRFAKLGNGISGILGNVSVEGVKFDEILNLVDDGVVGEIMNVVAEDGTEVSISVK